MTDPTPLEETEIVSAFDAPLPPSNLATWLRKRQLRREPDIQDMWNRFRKTYEQLWQIELLQSDPIARAILLRIATLESFEDIDSDMILLRERTEQLLAHQRALKQQQEAQDQQQEEKTKPSQKKKPSSHLAPRRPVAPSIPQTFETQEEQRRIHARLDGSGGRDKLNISNQEGEQEEEDDERSFFRM